MHDRLKVLFILALLLCSIIISCQEEPSPERDLESLELRFLKVWIGADLMPSIPPFPDPIGCGLEMELRNMSSEVCLTDLIIPASDAFLDSTGEFLCKILLTTAWNATEWDGRLEPGELDTVRLMKDTIETRPFELPCGAFVFLEVEVIGSTGGSKVFLTDSVDFFCVY